MIVADRRVTQELLRDSGITYTHAMSNEQLAERLRFLTGDRSAQVTNEFSDGFLKSLRRALADDLKLQLSGGVMPTKVKAKSAVRKPAVKPAVKAVRRGPYKTSRKSPGVGQFVLAVLKKASRNNPVTKAEILQALVKQFPERDPAKMANTLSKFSWWIYHDLGHKLHKNRQGGYWATRPRPVRA